MKIAGVLDNQFYLSGVNAYWSSMAQALKGLGHEVHTVALDDGRCYWNQLYFDHLDGYVHRAEAKPPSPKEKGLSLLRDISPDLVIHHYSDLGIEMSLSARSGTGDPHWRDVYVCHSDDPDHYNRLERWRDDLSHVICVSETCQDYLIGALGFAPEDTSLGHYFFIPPQGTGDAVIRKTGSLNPREELNILYAGRLETYQKRAGDLAPFVESLWKGQIPFRLQIAGSGSMEPQLRTRLGPFVNDGTVCFHGYLDEQRLFHLMEETHLYVSFSEFEGLSTSLIQAIHFGLIPLITPTKSGSDFLAHRKGAMFFNVGDTGGAARHVRWLLHRPDAHREMVRNAIDTVAKRFGYENSSLQLSSLLYRLENGNHDQKSQAGYCSNPLRSLGRPERLWVVNRIPETI